MQRPVDTLCNHCACFFTTSLRTVFYGNMVQLWKRNGTNIRILLYCKVSQNFTQTRIGTTDNISVTSVSYEDEKIFALVREYDFLIFWFCLVKEVELVDVLQILLTTLSANFDLRRGIRLIVNYIEQFYRTLKLPIVLFRNFATWFTNEEKLFFLCIFLCCVQIDWNCPPAVSSSIQQRDIIKLDIFA